MMEYHAALQLLSSGILHLLNMYSHIWKLLLYETTKPKKETHVESIVTHISSTQSTQRSLCSTGIIP